MSERQEVLDGTEKKQIKAKVGFLTAAALNESGLPEGAQWSTIEAASKATETRLVFSRLGETGIRLVIEDEGWSSNGNNYHVDSWVEVGEDGQVSAVEKCWGTDYLGQHYDGTREGDAAARQLTSHLDRSIDPIDKAAYEIRVELAQHELVY